MGPEKEEKKKSGLLHNKQKLRCNMEISYWL
jgi:hypothetical protein